MSADETPPSVISVDTNSTNPSRITVDSAEWTLASRISVVTTADYDSMPDLENVNVSEPPSDVTTATLEEPSSMTPLESTPMTEHELTTTTASSSNAPASTFSSGEPSVDTSASGENNSELENGSISETPTDVTTTTWDESVSMTPLESTPMTEHELTTTTASSSNAPASTITSGESSVDTSVSGNNGASTNSSTNGMATSNSSPRSIYTTTPATTISSVPYSTTTASSTAVPLTDVTSVPSSNSENDGPSDPSSAPSSAPTTVPSTNSHESPEEPSTVTSEATTESSLLTEYGPHPADPNLNVVDMEVQGTARVAALDTSDWIRNTLLCVHLSAYHKLLLVSIKILFLFCKLPLFFSFNTLHCLFQVNT